MLRGIDVSVYQSDLDVNSVAADFVVAKATGGTGYVNEHCDIHIQQAIAGGKAFGFYHYYADGWSGDDPIAEAEWFVNNCMGYFGHGIPVLDWESGGNPHVRDTSKALQWLQHVEARTGKKAIIYMSLSLIQSLDWSAVIAGNYGLWCAAYVDDHTIIPNYQMDPNRDPNPNWDGQVNDVLWQFTSSGRLDGYGGNLDCNFFYGNRATWDAYAGTNTPAPPEPTTTTTTQAPAPDPTTTTTTTEAPTPPDPNPEPTTTTTTTLEPVPPVTTTTTTGTPNIPTPGFWAGVLASLGAILLAIWQWLGHNGGQNNGKSE